MTTIETLRKAMVCVYIAIEPEVADSISEIIRQAAAELEALQKEVAYLKRRQFDEPDRTIVSQHNAAVDLQKELGKLKTDYEAVRQQNAELREALEYIARYRPASSHMRLEDAPELARKALATQPEDRQ